MSMLSVFLAPHTWCFYIHLLVFVAVKTFTLASVSSSCCDRWTQSKKYIIIILMGFFFSLLKKDKRTQGCEKFDNPLWSFQPGFIPLNAQVLYTLKKINK